MLMDTGHLGSFINYSSCLYLKQFSIKSWTHLSYKSTFNHSINCSFSRSWFEDTWKIALDFSQETMQWESGQYFSASHLSRTGNRDERGKNVSLCDLWQFYNYIHCSRELKISCNSIVMEFSQMKPTIITGILFVPSHH